MKPTLPPFHLSDFLWDTWCVVSVVGIWPRFIEPNLLETSTLSLQVPNLPAGLEGFKILQFSDLHLNNQMSDSFLDKLSARIQSLSPDMIVFTGDFLCYSKTECPERLKTFLNRLSAPYGCYAILGNHDYQECVSINRNGEYDIHNGDGTSMIRKGFSRLFHTPTLAYKTTARALETPPNEGLVQLLKDTPFQLLHNETVQVPIKDTFLNVCGLGEYVMGRADVDQAFSTYNQKYPGIILLHNPDGIKLLDERPGNLVLCGHTHGGQVYLPWMWKRFTLLENMDLVRGVKHLNNKTAYINRGVGGVMTFRWCARPEVLLTTLTGSS